MRMCGKVKLSDFRKAAYAGCIHFFRREPPARNRRQGAQKSTSPREKVERKTFHVLAFYAFSSRKGAENSLPVHKISGGAAERSSAAPPFIQTDHPFIQIISSFKSIALPSRPISNLFMPISHFIQDHCPPTQAILLQTSGRISAFGSNFDDLRHEKSFEILVGANRQRSRQPRQKRQLEIFGQRNGFNPTIRRQRGSQNLLVLLFQHRTGRIN